MYKKNYLHVLFTIEDITVRDGKFDFDKVLDGSYDFNVNDVSILYELVHTIETLAASRDILICMQQSDSVLKEFKYQYNDKIYQVSRFYSNDENTFITGNPSAADEDYVPEQELMNQIDEKCKVIMHRLNKIYEERSRINSAG